MRAGLLVVRPEKLEAFTKKPSVFISVCATLRELCVAFTPLSLTINTAVQLIVGAVIIVGLSGPAR